jgi:hypothetical protein
MPFQSLFHAGFHANPLLFSLPCMPCVLPCLIHFITLIVFREEYKSRNSSLCNFLHTCGTLSLGMRDQVSHTYVNQQAKL